jgi:VWFA-related protein
MRGSIQAAAVVSMAFAGVLGLGLLAQEPQQPPQSTPPATTPPPAAPAPTPAAQGQPAQQPPRPIFRTGTDLVRVDVVVLDRHGEPVPNLTANDFELQEDGAAQEIRSFAYVKADGRPDADDELSLPIRSRSHAATEAAKDKVRVFLIFWDEYHIGQMVSAARGRAALMRFVRTAFGPTDLVAFMDPLTTIDSLWFTRDRLELAESVRKLVGRSGVYVPTRSAVEDAQLQRGDVERLRSEVTVSALKAAAVHLGGLRDGRKSIILVSEGLRGMIRDGQALINDLVRTANDNNTAIYTIDPRGLGMSQFSSMFEGVSQDTGGQYFRNNDLEQSFKDIVTQSSGFYLLGYSGSERPMDGKFHKIKVKVKPPNLDVRARSGYWAPSVADVERAKATAAAAEIPPDIRRALSDLPSTNARRTIDLWIGTSVDAGRSAVRLSWSARDTGATAATAKPAQVTAVAMQGESKAFDGPVAAASGVSFGVPPGPLKVTVTVENSSGEIIDRDVRTIEVPDPALPALSIGSPAVYRAQTVREFRSLDRGPNAPPFAGREFARTDRVIIRFTVNGAARTDAKVVANIISQWGKDLAELPVTRVTPEETVYEIDLPLTSVARGDYLVSIGATAGSEHATAFVPMRVLR